MSDADVGVTADRTDRTVMHGRSAVRTTLDQHFAANRAELAANRISRISIRTEKEPSVNFIAVIRRTMRVRTIATMNRLRHRKSNIRLSDNDRLRFVRRILIARQNLDIELLGEPVDYLIVQLRSVTVLKSGKSRLFAADFIGKLDLANLRGTTGFLDFSAELWTEVNHERILWTLFYQLARG